jgi:sugar phosphate isomerase/epimerase
MKIPSTKIAINLYSVRDLCKTPADLGRTLASLKEIGYEAVQVSGIGQIPFAAAADLLKTHGLWCCATHEGLDQYVNGFETVIEKLAALNCGFTALGMPPDPFWAPGGADRLAAELSVLSRKFREKGLVLGYHNHSAEFERYGGRLFYEELFAKADKSLAAEIDTYWIQHGGSSPSAWIRRLRGRVPVIHFKDYTIIDRKPHECEVGEGSLDWKAIIAACRASGTRWYVVEQDNPVPAREILESARLSYRNLRDMGVR